MMTLAYYAETLLIAHILRGKMWFITDILKDFWQNSNNNKQEKEMVFPMQHWEKTQ